MSVTGLKTVVLALGMFSPANTRETLASEKPLRDSFAGSNNLQYCLENARTIRKINVSHNSVYTIPVGQPIEVAVSSPFPNLLRPNDERFELPALTELSPFKLREDKPIDPEIKSPNSPRILERERFQPI
jgi:hypothetical protein